MCPGNNDTDDDAFYDHRLASRGIAMLKIAKKKVQQGGNFFIGIGIRRPHTAWRMPRRFWELYNVTHANITLAKHQSMLGSNATTLEFERNEAYNFTSDGKTFHSPSPVAPLPVEVQAILRRGYYASISFMDYEVSEVGRKIDANLVHRL